MIKAFDGYIPQIGEGVFLADGAIVVGHVELGDGANVWYGAVIRGDAGRIQVGARSTVQDLACLHMKEGGKNVVIGCDVSIGHGAIIHGATVEDGAFIGNGAILMDGAMIGEQSVVAAGALVARGMIIPPRSLARGRPAKVIRELTEEEVGLGKRDAEAQHALALKTE